MSPNRKKEETKSQRVNLRYQNDFVWCTIRYTTKNKKYPHSQNLHGKDIVRKSEKVKSIKNEVGVGKVPDQRYGYHRKCYSHFTHKKSLAVLRKKRKSEIPELKRQSGRKRDRFGEYYDNNCDHKSKKTAKGGSGHEKLEKCLTEIGAKSLQEATILRKDNPDLMANVARKFLENILEVTKKLHTETKNLKDAPIDERIKDVASEIRKEVLDMNKSFPIWPPTEDQLIESNTTIPIHLKTFLERHNPSSRKQTKINSIGQDIIYCVKNGKNRTVKNTLLSLLCKRKTGSRQVVKWLNRFGHRISYDEICVLETSIALQQTKNQIQRKFVPSIVQPSMFVTFVWDNNDINPESLTGVAMHCTNGIIIQLAHSAPSFSRENPVSHHLVGKRERSFKGMPTIIDPIISKARISPAAQNAELLATSKGELHSRNLDIAWVMLRYQASSLGIQFAIPNWTGYNCLITNSTNSYHRVAHLPAIDKSLSKLETVAELLQQSKAKAEAVGLSETDVVADQAIYPKAVEVLMMPQYEDLKNFIVLRMGALHTSCTFLAVIGERFADAGLRDIIVEANSLGEGSVEKMLQGKHYNKSMRVLKYVFDALTRLKLQSFKSWLVQQNSTDMLESLLESEEMQTAIHDLSAKNLADLMSQHSEVFGKLNEYEEHLQKNNESGPMSRFWQSFLNMMYILFAFIRSIRTGDWKLHLESTQRMLPWMFAYDRPNYSRYLTFYWSEMNALPKSHPAIHTEFE
eukprot:gene8325-9216_t